MKLWAEKSLLFWCISEPLCKPIRESGGLLISGDETDSQVFQTSPDQ